MILFCIFMSTHKICDSKNHGEISTYTVRNICAVTTTLFDLCISYDTDMKT